MIEKTYKNLEMLNSEEKKRLIREEILNKTGEQKENEAKKSSFYGKVNKGLDWWENLGKNEKGIKGFSQRFGKTAVSLALIGLISSISVEKAAEMGLGTAAALKGGATAYLGRKIFLGLGISAVIELGNKLTSKRKKDSTPVINTKEEKEKNIKKEKRKKLIIQSVLLAGSIGAGLALTGGGLAVPIAAGAGFVVSQMLQKKYSAEKTISDRKKKLESILKKYKPEDLEGNLEKIQNEINEKINQWEERRKFWSKILRGSAAIGTSIAMLEVFGHAQESNLSTEAQETDTNDSTGTQPKEANPNENTSDEVNSENPPEINEINPEKATILFEKGAGGIRGIEQLQRQIQEQIDAGELDLAKSPAGLQEFMKENPTQTAINLGFFNPDQEAESLSVFEGSTLGFDENGNLSYHDIKNGEDHLLIKANGEITSYGGPMFDSAPVEETNLEDLQPDQDLIDRQVPLNVGSDYSAEGANLEDLQPDQDLIDRQVPLNVGSDYSAETSNEQIILEENEGDIQNEINQEGNEEINQENGIPAEETSGQDEINNINQVNIENPYDLTPEELKEVNEVYEKNIDKLFPNNEQAWNNIKTSTENYSAAKLVAWNPEEVNETYKPLIQNMQKLQEATGLNPIEATVINPLNENPENYIKRCLHQLTKMNILDKFKL